MSNGSAELLERLALNGISDPFDVRDAFRLALSAAYDGGDEEEEEEEEEDNDDASGSGGAGGDDKGGSASGDDTIKDPEKHRLSQEAKQRRIEAKQAKRERDEARAELQAIRDKEKPENDRLKSELEAEKAKTATLSSLATKAIVRAGVSDVARDNGIASDKVDYLRFLLNEGEHLALDDEYEFESDLDTVVKDLIKKNPSLVEVASGDDEGKGGDDEGEDGTPSGRPVNGKKDKGGKGDFATLAKKYPALNR